MAISYKETKSGLCILTGNIQSCKNSRIHYFRGIPYVSDITIAKDLVRICGKK